MYKFTLFVGKVTGCDDEDDMKEHSQILSWVKIHTTELDQCSLPIRKRYKDEILLKCKDISTYLSI